MNSLLCLLAISLGDALRLQRATSQHVQFMFGENGKIAGEGGAEHLMRKRKCECKILIHEDRPERLSILQKVSRVNRYFATKYGHQYWILPSWGPLEGILGASEFGHVAPQWRKIAYLKNVTDHDPDGCVLWLDSDAVIAKSSEDWLESFPEGITVATEWGSWYGEPQWGANAGVVVIKGPLGKKLVDEWWGCYTNQAHNYWRESDTGSWSMTAEASSNLTISRKGGGLAYDQGMFDTRFLRGAVREGINMIPLKQFGNNVAGPNDKPFVQHTWNHYDKLEQIVDSMVRKLKIE